MAVKEEESPLLTRIKIDEVECDEIKEENETTPSDLFVNLFMFGFIMCICSLFYYMIYYVIYPLFISDSRSVLTFELVCKTSDPNQIQQHLSDISATANYIKYKYLSTATTKYLLGVPDQYFSARTSFMNGRRPSKEWDEYYESLALQTTEQFFVMNRKSNNKTGDVKYVVVELIIAIASSYEIPTIKTFRNVMEALFFIKSLSISTRFEASDLFWTHPLDIEDVPSLNLIHLP